MSEREPTLTAADSESEITLGLLTAVHEDQSLTQRKAASQLGIALGLTNAYLKRCIKKGLIKVQQVPPNRYAYYLTPKGFAEKGRLTAEYLSSSFTFFRRARSQCGELMAECAARGWRRVALYGMSELAEIALLCARERGLALSGVVDPAGGPDKTFFELPVRRTLAELGAVDVVLVTDLTGPQASFERLLAEMPAERVLTPRVLRVSRAPCEPDEPAQPRKARRAR